MAPRPHTQEFVFLHAHSDKLSAWPRYKLKECWTLVLCLFLLRGRTGAVIVHNWWSDTALKFTREFRARRAHQVDAQLVDAPIIEPHAAPLPLRIFGLCLAALLMLVPVRGLIALTRGLMPRGIDPLVVYADGHLAGHALVLGAQAHGAKTLTLHHGLYRSDDRGSLMMIRNFVADMICLWDGHTRHSFLQLDVDPARLIEVGEYGFGDLSKTIEAASDVALLCPSYDVSQIKTFEYLGQQVPDHVHRVWSLHPMLRAAHTDLTKAAVADIDPRPTMAICGDTGALMDALARDIPVITVSDRPLATTHLSLREAQTVDPATLARLHKQANQSLQADRRLFGFDSDANHAEDGVKS